ncbi:MAG TPA: COX15/CtaA family protein [Bryobacteraceae bacterium]|nr:COX15/CtaA family protein [Bryobacteraceae bacterium]
MQRHLFSKLSWWFVGYLIAVILFGAWVRIAGAGAGCGNHWPLCDGEVLPTAPQTKKLIEFTHRVTSGLCGVFSLGLLWAAWKLRDRRVLWAALATLFFVLLEGLIGAVLVKKELVVNDASASRAIVIGLHLANTLLLMASATAMAWYAAPLAAAGKTVARGALLAAMGVLVLTNMTGAVTALGDTLFPQQPTLDGSLFAKLREDVTAGQHFLVRLRVIHPFVAVFCAAFLSGVVGAIRRRFAGDAAMVGLLRWPLILVGVQVLLGAVNITLAAPGWMQIVHLLTAQLVWVSVCVAYLALGRSSARPL